MNNKYKSSIGHHSSYIRETEKILKLYYKLESYDDLFEKIVYENDLNKSSESYRKMILKEVSRRYQLNKNRYEETPLIKIMNSNLSKSKEKWFLYYEFCEDRLIYKLITDLVYPKYNRGDFGIDKKDVLGYLEKLGEKNNEIDNWSEYTTLQVAEHFLSSLKNFGILEGSKQKKFKYVSPPNELVVYVLYSIKEMGFDTTEDIIKHDDWKLLMMDMSTTRNRLRRISPDFIKYEKRGSVEQIEFKYNSLEECIDDF